MDADQQSAKSDWNDESWALLVLALAAGAYSEMSLPLAWESSRFWRLTMGVAHVALFYGIAWLVGSLGILISERRRRRPRKWPLVGATLLLTAVTIYGSRSVGHVPQGQQPLQSARAASSPIQQAEVNEDGMRPYHGPVYPDEPRCPDDKVLVGGECANREPKFVRRGAMGKCPAGYVDHPSSPEMCTLPWVAERMLDKR